MCNFKSYILIILCCGIFAACDTEVDMCNVSQHPHRTNVAVQFEWGRGADYANKPDTVFVFAYRMVNAWKCGMAVGANTGQGRYLFKGAPDVITPVNPNLAQRERFDLPDGPYRMVAFNKEKNARYFDYVNLEEYMNDDARQVKQTDLELVYKAYTPEDGQLDKIVKDWHDYNPYSKYIQPKMPAVYFDTLSKKEIKALTGNVCRFAPHPLTQKIDVEFVIQKRRLSSDMPNVRFKVDSVFAEISGIPHKINLVTGRMDCSTTYKVMFRMNTTKLDGTILPKTVDSLNATEVLCKGTIDVISVIPNSSNDALTGPGVMCVKLYTSTWNDDTPAGVCEMQGKINLMRTINNAMLMRTTPDGKAVERSKMFGKLKVINKLLLNRQEVLESPSDKKRDRWVPAQAL